MADKKYEFEAVIQKMENLNSGFIEFPFDTQVEFNKKGLVKVKVLLDGYLYRGSLVKMGHVCHLLGITQEVRTATGKNPGDIIHIVLEEDTEERIVEIPADLKKLMVKEPGMIDFFNSLSFTHRKEYARWITEAKKEETRKNRLSKAIIMLREKRKTPD